MITAMVRVVLIMMTKPKVPHFWKRSSPILLVAYTQSSNGPVRDFCSIMSFLLECLFTSLFSFSAVVCLHTGGLYGNKPGG